MKVKLGSYGKYLETDSMIVKVWFWSVSVFAIILGFMLYMNASVQWFIVVCTMMILYQINENRLSSMYQSYLIRECLEKLEEHLKKD